MGAAAQHRGRIGILVDGFLGMLLEDCVTDEGYQVAFRTSADRVDTAGNVDPLDLLIIEVPLHASDHLATLLQPWAGVARLPVMMLSSPPAPRLDGVPHAVWLRLPFSVEGLLQLVAQLVAPSRPGLTSGRDAAAPPLSPAHGSTE